MIDPAPGFRPVSGTLVDGPPASVVSLVPSVTESLFDLNLGERVAGRTDYCLHPPAASAIPALGGTKYPDIARIIALRPALVIASDEENHQPDVILLPDEPYAFDDTHVTLFASLDVPAAKSGRIHCTDGSVMTWPGARLAQALESLPNLINPVDARYGS